MKDCERVRLERNFYIIGVWIPFIGGMCVMLYGLLPDGLAAKVMIPCTFHAVTGLYCPGCGGSRAVAALFAGRPLLSFFYHPIVAYCAGIYVWFMGTHTAERILRHKWRIGMRYRNGYLWIALGIVAFHTVVKNVALVVFHVDILGVLDSMW